MAGTRARSGADNNQYRAVHSRWALCRHSLQRRVRNAIRGDHAILKWEIAEAWVKWGLVRKGGVATGGVPSNCSATEHASRTTTCGWHKLRTWHTIARLSRYFAYFPEVILKHCSFQNVYVGSVFLTLQCVRFRNPFPHMFCLQKANQVSMYFTKVAFLLFFFGTAKQVHDHPPDSFSNSV